MWLMFCLVFISLNGVIGNGYYWRDYNGTIPSDAFIDKDTDLAIAKVYSEKYRSFHPTGLARSGGRVVKYEDEHIGDHIKVLCAKNTDRYYWKWVNAEDLRSTNENQRNLVEGGSDSSGYVYIAKVFIKGHFYIGELEGTSCYFHFVADCLYTAARFNWCQTVDCMVLKYK